MRGGWNNCLRRRLLSWSSLPRFQLLHLGAANLLLVVTLATVGRPKGEKGVVLPYTRISEDSECTEGVA